MIQQLLNGSASKEISEPSDDANHNGSGDPVDLVIHIIGSRWTIAIVRELVSGPRRPSELSKALHGISAKTLTHRLRDLEKWGLLNRIPYQEIPPRVEYSLTTKGRDLVFVLEALRDLGESWQRGMGIEVPKDFREKCAGCFGYMDSQCSADERA